MRLVDKEQLESWGQRAASQYIDNSVPLNETIEKIASDNMLNNEHIKRVCEFANVNTHLELFEKSADKRFSFPQACYEEVCKKVFNDTDGPSEKTAFDEYVMPPSYEWEIQLEDNKQEKTASENVEEKSYSSNELLDFKEKLDEAIRELEWEKTAAVGLCAEAEDDLYNDIKQMMLSDSASFKEVCAFAIDHGKNPYEKNIIKEALLKASYKLCNDDYALGKSDVVKLAGAAPDEYVSDTFESPGAPVMVRNGNLNMYYTLDTLIKQKERVSDYDKPLLHLNDSVRYVKRKLVNY